MSSIKKNIFLLYIIKITAILAIILKIEKCQGDPTLLSLDVNARSAIQLEVEGNPTTGFMWYVFNVTENMPEETLSSNIIIPEMNEEKKDTRLVTMNNDTSIIVSPFYLKKRKEKLIGAGSVFDSDINVLLPGTYYLKYIYLKASNPAEIASEIILRINATDEHSNEEQFNERIISNFFLHMNIYIENERVTLDNTVHVTMEGNPSKGELWFIYDIIEETDISEKSFKNMQQFLPDSHYFFSQLNNEKSISVTEPSCENSYSNRNINYRLGCVFGSVITPKTKGNYFVLFAYKNVSLKFVQKYKIVQVVVV